MRVCGQIGNGLLLDIPKSVFALAIEKFPNRTANTLLDNQVSVDDGKLQTLTQASTYCGFPGAG